MRQATNCDGKVGEGVGDTRHKVLKGRENDRDRNKRQKVTENGKTLKEKGVTSMLEMTRICLGYACYVYF